MDTLPPASKRYSSVINLVRDVHKDSPDFVKEVEERIESMDIGYSLALARSQNGVSESEMAERLGWDEGQILAMEYARNDSVKVGDMIDYVKALDTNFFLKVAGRDETAVDEIAFHLFECQKRMAELNKSLDSVDWPFSFVMEWLVQAIDVLFKLRVQDEGGVAPESDPESAVQGEQLAFPGYLEGPRNYLSAVVR